MAKGFSRLLRKAEASHAIYRIKIAKNAPPLTRLMFASDTLLFWKTTFKEVNTIHCLLLDFESMFGLQVNYSKSILLPRNLNCQSNHERILNLIPMTEGFR